MAQPTLSPTSRELDDFIRAYEAAQARSGQADWRAFLPKPDHPLYRQVQRELVRVDLEYAWETGRPKRLEEYQRLLPELFLDREGLGEIAFEEYRLRQQAGENPAPVEYQQRFGITTANWAGPCPASDDQLEGAVNPAADAPANAAGEPGSLLAEYEPPQDALLTEAALAYQEMRERHAGQGE